MKVVICFFITLFFNSSYSQINLDTIYGNPKSVREEIVFIKERVPKRYTGGCGNRFRNITRYKKVNLKNFFNQRSVSDVNFQILFNERGLKEKEIWFNISNEIERTFYYLYDRKDNLIEAKELFLDNVFWLTKSHYNKSNKIIASSTNYSDEPNDFIHNYYIRDIHNNIIETKRIDVDGEDYSFVYEFNNEGRIIKTTRKYLRNWRRSKHAQLNFIEKSDVLFEYNYDQKGNKILQLNYDESSNTVYSKDVSKFDSLNNLLEVKRYGRMNDTINYKTFKYNYNDIGLKVYEEETSPIDSTFRSLKIFYNHDNYIVKTIYESNDKTDIIDFKYRFDKKGNWIKIIKIVNEEPLCFWARKIKYYN